MVVNDKLQVFPSRANAVLMTQKILAAKRGRNLLLRKRDAIELKLRELRGQMADVEDELDQAIRKAIFSMTRTNLLGTDLKPITVADSRAGSAFLRKRQHKIVGVSLNYFELEMTSRGGFQAAGLGCGGHQVQKTREDFQNALRYIVTYASLEYMLRMLLQASHQTNVRVSALDYVILPQLTLTAKYVNAELEEYEREDFYRLKRSQAKQLETKQAFTELIKTKNMTEDELQEYLKKGGHKLNYAVPESFENEVFEKAHKNSIREAYLQRHSMQGQRKQLKREEDARPDPVAATFLQRRVRRDPLSVSASFMSMRSTISLRKAADDDDESSDDDSKIK